MTVSGRSMIKLRRSDKAQDYRTKSLTSAFESGLKLDATADVCARRFGLPLAVGRSSSRAIICCCGW